jgi:hypothetical protein
MREYLIIMNIHLYSIRLSGVDMPVLIFAVRYLLFVLYLKISWHQLEIWWFQIEFTGIALAVPVNGYLRPLNRQLMQ